MLARKRIPGAPSRRSRWCAIVWLCLERARMKSTNSRVHPRISGPARSSFVRQSAARSSTGRSGWANTSSRTARIRLYLISDLSTVWITADIYETDLPSVHVGAPVDIRLAAYPDRSFPARIFAINPTVDPATRTVKVRCVVSNPGWSFEARDVRPHPRRRGGKAESRHRSLECHSHGRRTFFRSWSKSRRADSAGVK